MTSAAGLFDYIFQLILISLRVGTLWMIFPIFSQSVIPPIVRLAGAYAIAMALHPTVAKHLPPWSVQHLPELPQLVFFILKELVVGLGMGFVAKWGFTTCVASAHWVGSQIGFSLGSVVNPESHQQDSAWADFHHWIGVMVFFSIGGHWLLIQSLADSYSFSFDSAFERLTQMHAAGEYWTELGRRFFVWMLKLSGPMVVVVLILQMVMGVLSKFVPQINVWMVSIPITLGVGVFIFTLFSPMYGDVLGQLFENNHEMNQLWLRFLGTR